LKINSAIKNLAGTKVDIYKS